MRSLMTGGRAHPPTLPELLELARPGTAEKAKSKHPDPFTREWNDARKALMDGIGRQSRDRGVQFTDADRDASRSALAAVDSPPGTAGHAAAREDQRREAARRMAPLVRMTPDELLAKWDHEAADHRASGTRTAA